MFEPPAHYWCESCDYTTEKISVCTVYDPSYSFTVKCKACNSLYDAYSKFDGNPEDINKCEYCRAYDFEDWDTKKKPCPRCGEKLQAQDELIKFELSREEERVRFLWPYFYGASETTAMEINQFILLFDNAPQNGHCHLAMIYQFEQEGWKLSNFEDPEDEREEQTIY